MSLNIRENGILEVDGLIVGRLEQPVEGDPDGAHEEHTWGTAGAERGELRIVLDLGWCKIAGLHVTLLDDREAGDNHRDGKAFNR